MRISIRGTSVEYIDTNNGVTLVLSDGAKIRAETLFQFAEQGSAPVAIDPFDASSTQKLPEVLHGRIVENATVDRNSGQLVIAFAGGMELLVPADPDFEAWSVYCADGSIFVALPGGGLSYWSDQLRRGDSGGER